MIPKGFARSCMCCGFLVDSKPPWHILPLLLQVLGETVDEAALTQILLAVLQDESASDDPKAIARGQAAAPPVGEVEAAARFIIKRFGKSAKRVAEQALKEVSVPVSWLLVWSCSTCLRHVA